MPLSPEDLLGENLQLKRQSSEQTAALRRLNTKLAMIEAVMKRLGKSHPHDTSSSGEQGAALFSSGFDQSGGSLSVLLAKADSVTDSSRAAQRRRTASRSSATSRSIINARRPPGTSYAQQPTKAHVKRAGGRSVPKPRPHGGAAVNLTKPQHEFTSDHDDPVLNNSSGELERGRGGSFDRQTVENTPLARADAPRPAEPSDAHPQQKDVHAELAAPAQQQAAETMQVTYRSAGPFIPHQEASPALVADAQLLASPQSMSASASALSSSHVGTHRIIHQRDREPIVTVPQWQWAQLQAELAAKASAVVALQGRYDSLLAASEAERRLYAQTTQAIEQQGRTLRETRAAVQASETAAAALQSRLSYAEGAVVQLEQSRANVRRLEASLAELAERCFALESGGNSSSASAGAAFKAKQ